VPVHLLLKQPLFIDLNPLSSCGSLSAFDFKTIILSLRTKRFKNLSRQRGTTYIMACTSCSTSDGGAPKGCKNNGSCGTDSCNKLTIFDWLSNMALPTEKRLLIVLRCDLKTAAKSFTATSHLEHWRHRSHRSFSGTRHWHCNPNR
jgi:hypothetical protein